MSDWNLRRVIENESPCDCCPPRHRVLVVEVYYDDEGKPWAHSDARLIDKIRFWRDWLRTPVLRFPEDFVVD